MTSGGYEALSDQIGASDPTDLPAQAALVERVRALQDSLERGGSFELAERLGLAAELGELVAAGGPEGAADVLPLIAGVVARVENDLAGIPGALPSATPLRHNGPELRLANEKLLGEILVQLGVVSEETVRKGLELQRATGQRIGETLVRMGAVNWDQLQGAVAVQARLKRACVTP